MQIIEMFQTDNVKADVSKFCLFISLITDSFC